MTLPDLMEVADGVLAVRAPKGGKGPAAPPPVPDEAIKAALKRLDRLLPD
ncbi:hypothetical protein [Phreatobacter sp.]